MKRIRSYLIALFGLGTVIQTMASVWTVTTFPFQTESGKWGFNFHEKSIIPARYDNVVPLSDNSPVFWAQDKGKWGLVGRYGQLLIPFIFDDVDVSLQSQTNQKAGYKIDGFKTFDGVAELDGTFLPREWRYMPEDGAYFPLLPVCKDGKWGYVDMEGKTIIDFDYDEAHVFNQYFNDNKKKSRWLAEVKKGRLRYWIDPAGGIATSMFEDAEIPERYYEGSGYKVREHWNKWLKKKLLKTDKEWKQFEKQTIDEVYSAREKALRGKPYIHAFSGEIKVDRIKPAIPSAVKSKKKGRKSPKKSGQKSPVTGKSLYKISYADGNGNIADNVDFVFDREGDVLRYKKNGKISMVNLNTRVTLTYDSIGPFDLYGRALAYEDGVTDTVTVDGAILYGEPSPLITGYEQLYRYADQGKNPDASAAINDYIHLLESLDNPWYILQFAQRLQFIVNDFNINNDPVKIAERQQRAQEKENNKSKSDGWGLLGDLLSLAGSFSDSKTSQDVKALGETINELSGNSSGKVDQELSGATVTSYSGSTAGDFDSRIAAIDAELKNISEEKAALARQRLSAKTEVRNSGARAVTPKRGADLVRNASPSRARQNAWTRANAQSGARSALAEIDNRMNALTERQNQLLSERKSLVASLENHSEDIDDTSVSKRSGKTGEKDAKKNKNAYFGYRNSINAIDRELMDLKEKASNQGLDSSDLNEVKSLKKKARKLREECLKVTGESIPSNSIENWTP